MDLGNAKFLLENLIGRMEQEGDAKRWKLEGSISAFEMDALQTILTELAAKPIEPSPPVTPELTPKRIPKKTKAEVQKQPEKKVSAKKAVTLNTTSLNFDKP